MKRLKISKITLSNLPESPGVYLFSDIENKVIYVGKSINLKARVNSYFSSSLGVKTRKMVEHISYLSFIRVDSEFEALILEAELVGKILPRYNSQLKDDKSPLYIGVTNDVYPRIITLRKTQIGTSNLKKIFGPFLQTINVRRVLKYLRRIFPYSQHNLGKRPCIYNQIGLCDPCPNQIEATINTSLKSQLRSEYNRNLKKIILILSGKLSDVRSKLEKEMQTLSKLEKYEQALDLRNKLNSFDYITSPRQERYYLQNPNLIEDIRQQEADELMQILSKNGIKTERLTRIECFDIAHLSGTNPTASMVTFINSEADKSLYRQFKLRRTKKYDDISGMKEVLSRRLNNFSTWGKPDLVIVDGGKAQLTIAHKILGFDFPVIGLAKRYETLVILNQGKFVEIRLPYGNAKKLLERIRNEAHRFARRLHHKLVAKSLIS